MEYFLVKNFICTSFLFSVLVAMGLEDPVGYLQLQRSFALLEVFKQGLDGHLSEMFPVPNRQFLDSYFSY